MSLDARLDVRVDDTVAFVFTVTNPTTERVELTFPDDQTAEVVVRSDDREVWRWSRGRSFPGASRVEALTPGEQARHTMTWTDPVAGTYAAVATLSARETTVTARNEFEVR